MYHFLEASMTAGSESRFSEKSDPELVAAFQKGDSGAIGELFSRYTPFLKSKAASLDCPYYFDDLLQEGKIGLFKAALHYDASKQTTFSSYATVCAFHEMLKFYNKAVVRQKENETGAEELRETVDRLSLDERLIGKEGAEFILKAIESELSALEKNVLNDSLSGLSYSETAVKRGISVKSVDNALTRIKRKLASKLADKS